MKVLLYIFLLVPFTSYAQGDWELKKEKDDIKVFLREIPLSPYKEIMVRLKCKSTLEKFREVILDIDKHKEWVYSNNILELVERVNENELIYYVEFSLPWPASNRDTNTHLRVISDSIPNKIFVNSRSVEGYTPLKEGNVRVTSSRTFWKVSKISTNELQIEYRLRLDPAGALPPWLVNLTATKGPFNSFSALKEILEEK